MYFWCSSSEMCQGLIITPCVNTKILQLSKIWITSKNEKKIFNGGYLGSRDDEERSEMRYAMRIAESASHQIFERKWWRCKNLHVRFSVERNHAS